MAWNDVEQTARELAGNWRKFECFAWARQLIPVRWPDYFPRSFKTGTCHNLTVLS